MLIPVVWVQFRWQEISEAEGKATDMIVEEMYFDEAQERQVPSVFDDFHLATKEAEDAM